MKKILFVFSISMLFLLPVYGQVSKINLNSGFRLPAIPDSSQTNVGVREEMPPEIFNEFFNKQFSKIITPNSNSNIGRFAALDIANAQATLATNFNLSKGVLGVKFVGSALDGIAPLINNSKLNTGVELSAQYNFVVSNTNALLYDAVSFEKYQGKFQEIRRIKKLTDSIGYSRQKQLFELQKIRLNAKAALLEAKKETLEAKVNAARGSSSMPLLTMQRDSIVVDLLKSKSEIESLNSQIARLGSKDKYLYNVNRAFAENERAAREEIKIIGGRFSWFSIGYGMKHASFRLFNPSAVYAAQVIGKNAYSHDIRLQYSVFNNTTAPNETYYWDIGLTGSLRDNLSSLKKKTIREEDTLRNGSKTRIIYDDFVAYQGEYKIKNVGIMLCSNYYKFFGEDNRLAWHLAAEHRILESNSPKTNFGTGLLVTFQDRKDVKTIVNAEIFANAVDVFDNEDDNESFFKRSTIEIRLTFPLMFNLIK